MQNEEAQLAQSIALTIRKSAESSAPTKTSKIALQQPSRVLKETNNYLLNDDGRPARSRCLRRIRYLADTYELRWIVDQRLIDWGYDSLKAADEDDVYLLALDLETGRRCQREDDNLEDYGLVRRL